MISPLARKKVDQLNSILRQELGENSGQQRYKWMYSDTLTLPMVMLDDQEDPQPLKESVCSCGVDKRIHSPTCNSLSIVRYKCYLRPLLPQYPDQWALCSHMAPGVNGFPSESDWGESFSGQFPYPRNGYYIPMSDSSTTIVVRKGILPTLDFTTKMIGMIREEEMMTAKMWDEMEREEYAREMVNKQLNYEYRIKQCAPLGETSPGTKSNYIIVP